MKKEFYIGALSHKAAKSCEARRRFPAETDRNGSLMTLESFCAENDFNFTIDSVQKILPSKAFARLSHKTQAVTSIVNAHVRNRSRHTGDVVDIGVDIGMRMGLNAQLIIAIGLAHDIGHPPFSHLGEKYLSQITGKKFSHEVWGVIIAQHIERKGKGLNLTKHTLEGILKHSRGNGELTRNDSVSEEANVIMYADKIAYIWHDLYDIFERTRILDRSKFPDLWALANMCGETTAQRRHACIEALCRESAEKGCVSFEDCEIAKIIAEIKALMYAKVYDYANLQESEIILQKSYNFLKKSEITAGVDPAIVLALMTDKDVFHLYNCEALNAREFYETSVAEIVEHLKGKNLDFTDPDLNW